MTVGLGPKVQQASEHELRHTLKLNPFEGRERNPAQGHDLASRKYPAPISCHEDSFQCHERASWVANLSQMQLVRVHLRVQGHESGVGALDDSGGQPPHCLLLVWLGALDSWKNLNPQRLPIKGFRAQIRV